MVDTLRVERNDGIVEVTIDRPSHRNALDKALWDGLLQTSQALRDDPPRAVILTGAAGHFCAGMDLSPTNPLFLEIGPLVQARDAEGLKTVIRYLKSCLDGFRTIGAPVIAAIEGVCLGGGLELALVADIRVATESSRFSLPETRFGMVPDVGGTVRLSKLVGTARAAQLILTGETIGSEVANRWGLVNEVVPDGSALDRARELAASIAKCSPAATTQALRALRQTNGLDDAQRFDLETEAGATALVSGEVFEGIASFATKRAPNW